MIDQPEGQISIKDYLLGQLSEQERQQVEERLLTDDAFFEEISIAENELIDRYLNGSLAPQEVERFREHFLVTPEQRRNLQFAKVFRRYVSENQGASDAPQDLPRRRSARWVPTFFSGGHRPWAVPALVMVLALVLISVVWALLAGGRGGDSALAQEVARLNEQGTQPPQASVSLILNARRTRESGEVPRLTSSGSGVVQLRFVVARDEYEDYSASLMPVGGRTIVTVNQLRRISIEERDVVALNLPAGLLKRGDYEVELSGATPGVRPEAVGVYFFRVTGD